MARKLAHKQASREGDSPSDCKDGSFTRRAYARLGTTAVATVVSLGGWLGAVTGARPFREHRIRIRGSGTASTYELTVEEGLVPGDGSKRDAENCISGCTAEGAVTSGDRRYRFSGELLDVRVDGGATVSLDGVTIDS